MDYRFLHSMEEIDAIEIVKIDIDNSTGIIEQISICSIEDIDTFMDDFSRVTCYWHYSDPTAPGDDARVIKIGYNNGEYELIAADGQSQYTNDRLFQYYTGYRYFDEEQFDELISKYVENIKD